VQLLAPRRGAWRQQAGERTGITMRDPQRERINNRIENLLDDLLVLKGLERSGSDVSAYIQTVSQELQQLNQRKQGQDCF
jgi:hypothetical protein